MAVSSHFPYLFYLQFWYFSLRAENPLTAYFNQLTFSVTLHMSSIIIFSPSLSQPTSLPPGSPSLFLFSIICQPFALAIKKCSQGAGEASLSVRMRRYTDVVFMESVLAQTDAG